MIYQITKTIAISVFAASTVFAEPLIITTPPENPDPKVRYLFYLHGKSIDEGSLSAHAPYKRVVEALSERGFVVVSEMRRSGLIRKFPHDHEKYSKKIANEVNDLLAKGVAAGNVFVSGYSRGGTLTLMISAILDNPNINFIVMAGCISVDGAYKDALPIIHERYSSRLKGHFLSLRESTDEDFGSCQSHFGKGSGPLDYKEVVISTGKGHLAFQEPIVEWIEPIAEWARTK